MLTYEEKHELKLSYIKALYPYIYDNVISLGYVRIFKPIIIKDDLIDFYTSLEIVHLQPCLNELLEIFNKYSYSKAKTISLSLGLVLSEIYNILYNINDDFDFYKPLTINEESNDFFYSFTYDDFPSKTLLRYLFLNQIDKAIIKNDIKDFENKFNLVEGEFNKCIETIKNIFVSEMKESYLSLIEKIIYFLNLIFPRIKNDIDEIDNERQKEYLRVFQWEQNSIGFAPPKEDGLKQNNISSVHKEYKAFEDFITDNSNFHKALSILKNINPPILSINNNLLDEKKMLLVCFIDFLKKNEILERQYPKMKMYELAGTYFGTEISRKTFSDKNRFINPEYIEFMENLNFEFNTKSS